MAPPLAVTGWDSETHLVRESMVFPRPACLTFDDGAGRQGLLGRREGIEWLRGALRAGEVLAAHEAAYDLGVFCAEDPALLSLARDALSSGRARCTTTWQKLIDVAMGWMGESKEESFRRRKGEVAQAGMGLDDLVKWYFGRELPKEDTWRLRFGELDQVPVRDWPPEASGYAIRDATEARLVHLAQLGHVAAHPKKWPSAADFEAEAARQCRHAFWLHLAGGWGARTDPAAARFLRENLEAEAAEYAEELRGTGILRGDGSKNLDAVRERVVAAYAARGLAPPMTAGGKTRRPQVSTKADVLVATMDPVLLSLAAWSKNDKLRTTYAPVIEAGARRPVCGRYDVLKRTGRTSMEEPNLQNPPRAGGIRECFVPRPGRLWLFADYDTAELRALAQILLWMFGRSSLAEAFREGRDPHLELAAELLGISREEAERRYAAGDKVVEDARQLAKILNFGIPGGLGEEGFVAYAAGYGIKDLSLEAARRGRQKFLKRWSEMPEYFRRVKVLVSATGESPVRMFKSGRVRGAVGYTDGCNGFFQALVADMAKDAFSSVSEECYCDRGSALYGCRPVLFLHDELGLEAPGDLARANAAAGRLAEVMLGAFKRWIPDVPGRAQPVLMRRWWKGAKPVREGGLLVPCRPVERDGKKRWVRDDDGGLLALAA